MRTVTPESFRAVPSTQMTGRWPVAAVVLGLLWAASVPGGRTAASEVISAIPGEAQPPFTPGAVVEAIEAGTRGPGPAPRQAAAAGCTGDRCSHGRCSHGGCRHAGCEIPGCPAHCPVRPATFGFYGTQWRTWPGQGVVQAARAEPAAPVMPPKSEVPTADEESPVPGFEPPPPEPDAVPEDVPEPMLPDRDSAADSPAPAILPPPDERPKADAPAPAPEAAPSADNLFDEASLRRRSQERLVQLGQAALQQDRVRRDALRQQMARLARVSPKVASHSSTDADAAADAVTQTTHVAPEPRPVTDPQPEPLAEPRGLRSAGHAQQPGNPLR